MIRQIIIFFFLSGVLFSCTLSEDEYVSKSRELLENGSYEKSLQILNEAIDHYKSAMLYNLRGVTNYELKNYNKAVADYDNAIKLDSSDYRPFYNRGKIFFEQKDYSSALDDFTKSMNINASVSDIYLNRGNCFFEMENYQDALKDYDFALKLEPHSYLVNFNKARAHIMLGQQDEAINLLENAVNIDPDKGETFYYLALAKHLKGNNEDFCVLYDRSKELGYQSAHDQLASICTTQDN